MQFYTDRTRRNDPHALPDAEVFPDVIVYCDNCGDYLGSMEYPQDVPDTCPACGGPHYKAEGYFWWSCFPGCLPDSDPVGPFPNIFRAVRDARRF